MERGDRTEREPAGSAGPELGTIEGFYGRPWTWEERTGTMRFLAPHGYRFYLYAPKADAYLRRRWREPHPAETRDALARFGGACRDAGVRFGIGLSPYEIFRGFDDDARDALARKLSQLDDLEVDDLALLFDDMRGDTPELAARQLEVVAFARERTRASRVLVCPSYYSDDPVLDRVFGARPRGYLEELGAGLDAGIQIFWTGPEVVSRAYSPAHLRRVSAALGRRPFLWDNYPVNDGQRMSQFLHLRGFTGRPASLTELVAGHGVNPALQPTLTRIPMLTLVDRYRLGGAYDYAESFRRAAAEVLGPALGERLREDLLVLQDVGLDRLEEKEARLRDRYGGEDHPGAREIIAWLDGEYRITDEIVQTQ
ncbi:MAG: hyaluronidase [Gemmatimonadetes bacterium]|nr:hyaluronidase [Gemmatimonadota bacterium]NIQ52611.1 hyaluronidase [Gemmatimonadota bacterium]NIU72751.1 hyaluronidase [Gammaproteobacteria bacterium]NIX43152.1 hyaluronidase [Gemmatimonadota bacterium]NIY07315.1 hyaluronidase [Gemmatimonadota bacterium]